MGVLHRNGQLIRLRHPRIAGEWVHRSAYDDRHKALLAGHPIGGINHPARWTSVDRISDCGLCTVRRHSAACEPARFDRAQRLDPCLGPRIRDLRGGGAGECSKRRRSRVVVRLSDLAFFRDYVPGERTSGTAASVIEGDSADLRYGWVTSRVAEGDFF